MASTAAAATKIQTLQAGRALAAIAVVLHHSAISAEAFGKPFYGARLAEYGYLGVDFFFVLSGFIIYHSTVGRGRSAWSYASARFRRVYVPYWPVGIAVALLYAVLPTLSAANRDWSWLSTLTLLPIEPATALSVAWTLKHEILFYALFGILYFNRLLLPGFFVWGAFIIANAVTGYSSSVPLAPVNLEFMMGVCVAILAQRGKGHPLLMLLSILPVGLWIQLGATENDRVLLGLAFALIILPVVKLEWEEKLQVPPVLVFFGGASYAIYLVHLPIVSAVSRLLIHQSGILIFALCSLMGLLGGVAYFWFYERPALKFAAEVSSTLVRPGPRIAVARSRHEALAKSDSCGSTQTSPTPNGPLTK